MQPDAEQPCGASEIELQVGIESTGSNDSNDSRSHHKESQMDRVELTYTGPAIKSLAEFLPSVPFVESIKKTAKSIVFTIPMVGSKGMTASAPITFSDEDHQLVASYLAALSVAAKKLSSFPTLDGTDRIKDWHKVRQVCGGTIDRLIMERGATKVRSSNRVKYLLGELWRGGTEASSAVELITEEF